MREVQEAPTTEDIREQAANVQVDGNLALR